MNIRKSKAEREAEGRAATSSISLGDAIDFRAMLARTRTQARVRAALVRDVCRGADSALLSPRPQAGGASMPIFPKGFVNVELDTGEAFRVRHERAGQPRVVA